MNWSSRPRRWSGSGEPPPRHGGGARAATSARGQLCRAPSTAAPWPLLFTSARALLCLRCRYCPIQALAGTGTPSPRGPRTLPALLPSPAPALRHSSLDLHQQQLAAAAAAGPALMEGCGEEVGPSAFPTTPTRHSAGYGSSSWSESHQCTLPADPQEVQSPGALAGRVGVG